MGSRGGDPRAKRPKTGKHQPAQEEDSREPALPEAFSPEFYAQVNRGPLEEAYERHNRDPKNWNPIPWGLLVVGVLVGILFAVVNVYAALSLGIIVGVSWYLIFFAGAMLGWQPGTINYVGGASTGASQIVIPIAFVLPTLFFLTTQVSPGGFYTLDALPSPYALGGFFLVGAVLGLMMFQMYRHLWIVRRPLQYPGGFESASQLLRLTKERDEAGQSRLRESVFAITVGGLVSGFWVLLRDLQAFGPAGARTGFFDQFWRGRWFEEGIVPAPWETRPLYNGLFYLDPFFMAIGWFLRAKIAIILLLGALVTFVLPFFDPAAYEPLGFAPTSPGSGLVAVWAANARLLAAAAILGAGVVALVRLRGPIAEGMRAIFGGKDPAAMETKRPSPWFAGGIALSIGVSIILLWLGGLPILGALLVVPLSVLLVGLLGFIAVKITGETAIQALSPMMTIGFLFFLVLLSFVGFSAGALVMLLVGVTAFFGAGIIMSTDVFLDTKVGHYIGNPPHRQAIAQASGLLPGVIVGTALVWFLSGLVADEIAAGLQPSLAMPFARVFSGLAQLGLGGEIPWLLLGIAFLLGASVEYGTRLGTVFAIGMVLQLFVPVTVLAGALVREGYEAWFAPPETGEGGQRGLVMRIAAPTGVFVGAALAALVVFALNLWVL